jgi:hypothetical protein
MSRLATTKMAALKINLIDLDGRRLGKLASTAWVV